MQLPDLSAVELRALIGRKEVSPVALLDACIERIENIDPALNAITATCFGRARQEAAKAEKAVLDGDELGLLHGLPLGVKDLSETEGLLTTFGSPLFRDNIPVRDEGMIESVRKAGAIVVAKTNTSEFGSGAVTNNPVFGPTGNPFDLSRTCGGSSGGSAVALATSMLPLCTGSDAGGSLRIPAAFCGVVGFRPTPGLVPSERRALGWTPAITSGPMARNVEDAFLLLRAQVYSDVRDPMSAGVDPRAFDALEAIDLSKLRVACSEDLGSALVERTIRDTLRARVGLVAHEFASCDWRDPDMRGADESYSVVRAVNYMAGHGERYHRHRDRLSPNIVVNYEEGLALTGEAVAHGLALQTRIYRRMQEFFKDVDILISPTVSVPPIPITQNHPTDIDGRMLSNYFSWLAPTYYMSLVGHPCISIPCGRDPTGTPFALQITGAARQDKFMLAVANAIEKRLQRNALTRRPMPDIDYLRREATARMNSPTPPRGYS